MAVLALALYQRLKSGSPALAQTATAIGLIWATVIIASGLIRNFGMSIVVDLYSDFGTLNHCIALRQIGDKAPANISFHATAQRNFARTAGKGDNMDASYRKTHIACLRGA